MGIKPSQVYTYVSMGCSSLEVRIYYARTKTIQFISLDNSGYSSHSSN